MAKALGRQVAAGLRRRVMPEITRTDCDERAWLLRVDSYDITVDLTRGEQVFRSTSVIVFRLRRAGQRELCRPDRRRGA